MRINLYLLLLASFFTVECFGQNTFQKLIIDAGNTSPYGISSTYDGGYIITGVCNYQSAADLYLVKLDANGNNEWSRVFSNTNNEFGKTIQQTPDSGFFITGASNYVGPGSADGLAMKLDKLGNLEWYKVVGAGYYDEFRKGILTTDGNQLCIGYSNGFTAEPGFWVSKLSPTGGDVWKKVYGSWSRGSEIIEITDGGYMAGGRTTNFGAGGEDAYIIKMDVNGNKLWDRVFGGAQDEHVYSIIETIDNGFLLLSETSSFGSGGKDIMVTKINSSGVLQWSKVYGGANDESSNWIKKDINGGYVIGGYTESFGNGQRDGLLIKIDSQGDTLWTRTYGGSTYDKIENFIQLSNGQFVLSVTSNSFSADNDALVVKTDSLGWVNCYSGNTSLIVNSVNPASTTGGGATNRGGVYNVNISTLVPSYTFEELEVNASIISSNDLTCFNDFSGSASSQATGGSSPYDYIWSSGATTANVTGLSAGTYTVTISDAQGCSDTAMVSLTQPPQLNLTMNVTSNYNGSDVSCNGDIDGEATATPTGGSSPYTYDWSSGGSSATETGLGAGTYTVTITDDNGCTSVSTVTVNDPPVMSISISSPVNVDCFGNSTGEVTAAASGGTGSYSYDWSSGGSNTNETGLSAGTYSVTITDENGCTDITTVTITEPPALTGSITNTPTSNAAECDGAATAAPVGGTSPYTYQWDDTNTQTTQQATGLCPGTYCVTITDANGCTWDTCGVDVAVGINNPNQQGVGVQVYPNPNNGVFTVELNGTNENTQVRVTDALGREIASHSFAKTGIIDLSKEGKGVYHLILTTNNQVITKKIIIQ